MSKLSFRLGQAGDTIVEVLICMAIVSLALGSSYGISVRALIQVREAEERGQATRLAAQQVEFLKQLKQLGDTRINDTSWPPGSPIGYTIVADSSQPNGLRLDPYSAAPPCDASATAAPNVAVVKSTTPPVIPGQFYVGAGFCLVGGGLAAGSQYDVVTFVVRIN